MTIVYLLFCYSPKRYQFKIHLSNVMLTDGLREVGAHCCLGV